jgi:hypothetical protein
MKKVIAALIAVGVVFTLAGCGERNIPNTGSEAESAYILACSKLGGFVIPGQQTPGVGEYRDVCAFRYPALPTVDN